MLITKFLVALAAPVFCIAATIPANTGGLVVPRSPISGGDAAEPGESVSTVVSIQKLGRSQRGVHICGGSFLTRYLVITATHCVRGVAQQELRVLAGTTSLTGGGAMFEVLKKFYHPEHDVVILQLRRDPNGRRLRGEGSVKLPLEGSDPSKRSKSMALAYGWGFKSEPANPSMPGIPSTILQEVSLEILPRSECDFYMPRKTQYICAVSPKKDQRGIRGREGVCDQDDGGPLIGFGNKLLGVLTVQSRHCGRPENVAVFIRVGTIIGWINHVGLEVRMALARQAPAGRPRQG